MRRTGNSDETKRILMDLDVVLKSIDCRHIVVCLGCFITASDVWICMELMSTCFDKLLKHLKQPIPEQARQKTFPQLPASNFNATRIRLLNLSPPSRAHETLMHPRKRVPLCMH